MKKYTFSEIRNGLSESEIADVCKISFRIWNDFIATQKEMAMIDSYEDLCKALTKKQQKHRDHYDECGVLDYSTFI